MSATAKSKQSQMGDKAIVSGKAPNDLANAVSDAIHAALQIGMEPDEACRVAAEVVADYARGFYGNEYLPHIAAIITSRAEIPLSDAN